jgi:DHA2 family multidrug resistance protein
MRALSLLWLFVIATTVLTIASVGCAASQGFKGLIAWRVLQVLAGGTLILAVFAAVFLLFPPYRQGLAATLAGVVFVLAPTVGPIIVGWITSTYSWHCLFLVNVVPGILAVLVAAWLVTAAQPQLRQIRQVDWLSLAGMALALAALEIALKEVLSRGRLSPLVLVFLAVSAASGAGFIRRSLQHASPVVALRSFNDRRFTIACILFFVRCFAFFSRSGRG